MGPRVKMSSQNLSSQLQAEFEHLNKLWQSTKIYSLWLGNVNHMVISKRLDIIQLTRKFRTVSTGLTMRNHATQSHNATAQSYY